MTPYRQEEAERKRLWVVIGDEPPNVCLELWGSILVAGRQPTFAFVLPESFQPAHDLPSHLHHLQDDARYLISTILTKTARGAVDARGMVRLHAAYLRGIMHYHLYRDVIEALLDAGAIERYGYRVGKHSFGFVLTQRYLRDRHVRVPVTDRRLSARLAAYHEQVKAQRLGRMLPVHHALAWLQQQLDIDGDLAREILKSVPPERNPLDLQGILVGDIERREFRLNVGRFGRVSNNITNIMREIRTTLHQAISLPRSAGELLYQSGGSWSGGP
jgi:hypothetical protein